MSVSVTVDEDHDVWTAGPQQVIKAIVQRTSEETQDKEDLNPPITAHQHLLIVRCNQPTLLPDADQQYTVKMS